MKERFTIKVSETIEVSVGTKMICLKDVVNNRSCYIDYSIKESGQFSSNLSVLDSIKENWNIDNDTDKVIEMIIFIQTNAKKPIKTTNEMLNILIASSWMDDWSDEKTEELKKINK